VVVSELDPGRGISDLEVALGLYPLSSDSSSLFDQYVKLLNALLQTFLDLLRA
jgi:hypothetical protein